MDPDDEVVIQWDRDHDWRVLVEEYNEGRDFSDDSAQYEAVRKYFVRPVEAAAAAAVDNGVELNELQKLATEMIRDLIASPDADAGEKLGMLLGKGGTGKSTVINAVVRELEEMHGVGCVLKLAPTGIAATVINGSTLHSGKYGLGLPVGRSIFKLPKGKRLSDMQERLKKTVLVLIDEFSMLRAKELWYTHQILQAVFGNDELFGGIAVVLCGDTGQIPAVLGSSVWDKRNVRDEHDTQGQVLYASNFKKVIQLTEVKRVVADQSGGSVEIPEAPSAERFLEILDSIRDGAVTNDDWKLIGKICSRYSMSETKWKERFGKEEDITFLFTTNAKVKEHNAKMLKKLNKPIALIEAQHTGKSKSMSSSSFMGLQCSIYLVVGAKVVMTCNVCQQAGLCNGATGNVKDLVYDEDVLPPRLPKFVWVDFDDKYKGPSFFPGNDSRRGWFPVHPIMATEWTPSSRENRGYEEHSRTMLPLSLAWAWTVWKSQGQTLKDKVVCELGSKEPEAGITYTAFSRVTKMVNFGVIGGLTLDRLTTTIKNHAKFPGRIKEEQRLRLLSANTVDMLRQRTAGP